MSVNRKVTVPVGSAPSVGGSCSPAATCQPPAGSPATASGVGGRKGTAPGVATARGPGGAGPGAGTAGRLLAVEGVERGQLGAGRRRAVVDQRLEVQARIRLVRGPVGPQV